MEEGKEERANESADDRVEIAFSDTVEEAAEDDFFGDGGNDDGGDIPVIADGEHIEAGPRVRVTFIEEAAQCLTAA